MNEDLVEVPTMVLNRQFADVSGLKATDFLIRLDAGQAFRPEAVRLEGDDPLQIAVLVDVSEAVPEPVVADFQRALPELVPGSLNDHDRVTLYAVDCGLFESPEVDAPASANSLVAAMSEVLANPNLHKQESGRNPGCHGSRRLWDAIAAVAGQVGRHPGRRVLVVLTDGVDSGSANSWEQVREYANGLSLTLFAIRPQVANPGRVTSPSLERRAEDPLSLLCANTGGTVLGVNRQNPQGMSVSLRRGLTMIRNRYVLYFPRPGSSEAGRHRIDVSIGDPTALVRPSGAVFPPKGEAAQADPSVLPNHSRRVPEYGSRRILQRASPL